ncbi:MAG: metallophosphoesterase [Oscillospiraceae bacterium]|nr:metallophosphoesterase [Oscillospiraceae bacterium]
MIGFKGKRPKRKGGVLTFAAIVLVIAGVFYNWNYTLQTEEFELKFADLPPAFDGFRIAIISDLHDAKFGKENAKLIDAVRGLNPDIIALTGDVTDETDQVPDALNTVRALVEIAPVYYVSGNHEWEDGGIRELFAGLPEVGAAVLRNEIIPIERGGDVIYLIGLEDKNGPADMEQPESVFARKPDGFSVTLIHRNTYLERLAPLGANLILCGHAHGGLIRLPGTDGLLDHNLSLFPTHTSGVYTSGATTMLVSRGIGNHTGIPRVMNKPHIPVAILKREV